MSTHRTTHTVRTTSRHAVALMVAALPILALASCGEARPTVDTAAEDNAAETSTTTGAGSSQESTTSSAVAESASTTVPSTTAAPDATTSSTVVPETTGAPTTQTTAAPDDAPTVIATGPSISVEELPGSSTTRVAAPSEQVRLRMSGNFPMRSARLFVLIDGAVVGVGAPGATSGETIVDTTPRSAIVNGAKVSYRWESGPTTDVGALTVK